MPRQGGGVPGEATERARAMWEALVAHLSTGRGDRTTVLDRRGGRAALWPLTQVIHAAALLGPLGVAPDAVDPLLRGLGRFDAGRGWTATPWPSRARRVFYDDNAWLGLAAMQAWLMSGGQASHAVAQRASQVSRRGEHPDGGVVWHERTTARHACATAPTVMLALRLTRGRTPNAGEAAPDVTAFVERSLHFLDHVLVRPDGLVADHVDAAGAVEGHAWSYNQGATIGAHLLAWQVLGRQESLQRAQWLATAAAEYLGAEDRLWREPPAFVAVFLRQLMALDAVMTTTRWAGVVERYLDRVWLEGRDRETGLVTAGGIGRYDESVVIDQAAVVQLYALTAMPEQWRRLAC